MLEIAEPTTLPRAREDRPRAREAITTASYGDALAAWSSVRKVNLSARIPLPTQRQP